MSLKQFKKKTEYQKIHGEFNNFIYHLLFRIHELSPLLEDEKNGFSDRLTTSAQVQIILWGERVEIQNITLTAELALGRLARPTTALQVSLTWHPEKPNDILYTAELIRATTKANESLDTLHHSSSIDELADALFRYFSRR